MVRYGSGGPLEVAAHNIGLAAFVGSW